MNYSTIRPYEMSVWTLRDTYITSLRVPGVENKGQIEDAHMRLNTDGTAELEFNIPMYIHMIEYKENEGSITHNIENPRWYDVKRGLLMVGLRKIKVIFNKNTNDEEIYEFLVMQVNEEHGEDNSLYCRVQCSGLAFQELGKKGFKRSLSAEEYYLDYNNYWDAEDKSGLEEPINNINYWCEKVFNGSDWTYSIQMDWEIYDGYVLRRFEDGEGTGIAIMRFDPSQNSEYSLGPIVGIARVGQSKLMAAADINKIAVDERIVAYYELTPEEQQAVNERREELHLRRNDKIYEEDYIASWDMDEQNFALIPKEYIGIKEKNRMVESSESNMYNASQAIAETFGVFCCYKYHYDKNNHIIKKEVIFYNDFMDELHGTIDLTYNYNVDSMTRTMDSNDVYTKLIVRSVEDDSAPTGQLSIMNTEANKSLEDYLLNFDYLYQTGSIEQDQYDAVPLFEYNMRVKNQELINLSETSAKLSEQINEYEAAIAVANNSVIMAQKQVDLAYAGIRALTKDETGTIEVTPKIGVILKNNDEYYINITTKGVIEQSIKIYKSCYGNEVQGDPITPNNYELRYDESGNINKIVFPNLTDEAAQNQRQYYLVYSYEPQTYYQNIINTFKQKAATSLDEANEKTLLLERARDELETITTRYNQLLEEKEEAIQDFENLMGPALREGTWQPDSYDDYGDKYSVSISSANGIEWDDNPFENEDLPYEEVGVNQPKQYYPYIKLNTEITIDGETTTLLDYFSDNISSNVITYPLQFRYSQKLLNAWQSGDDYTFTFPDGTPVTPENLNASAEDKIADVEGQVILSWVNKNVDSSITSLDDVDDGTKDYVRRLYGLTRTDYEFCSLGSDAYIGFIQENSAVVPVLVITGINRGTANSYLQFLADKDPALCISELQITEPNVVINNEQATRVISDGAHLSIQTIFPKEILNITVYEATENDVFVYPRFNFNSLAVKTSEDQLKVMCGSKLLSNYYDYYILNRDNSYYLTFDSASLVHYWGNNITINYIISNAELNIYLDALEVLRTNAYPQASYTVKITVLNEKFIHIAYKYLSRLAHISDYELKLKDVLGYISELDLDLDRPWNDTVDIKNYKTKFEDLFSKIVASSEQMKSNATIYNKAAAAFDSNGNLKEANLQNSFNNNNLSFGLIGGLKIDNTLGIYTENENGILAFNNEGIFSAREKDNNGNWTDWEPIILPNGINASLLKAGTIDTNLIKIFSGDSLRFQMNATGLYAYKQINADEADTFQYVVHNSDGLFLKADKGVYPEYIRIKKVAKTINEQTVHWPVFSQDNSSFITEHYKAETPLENDVERAAISWDGLRLSNWAGEPTFYADPDTGDLIIAGTLLQDSSFISIPEDTITEVNQILNGVVSNTAPTPLAARIIELLKDEETAEEPVIKFFAPKIATIKIDEYMGLRAQEKAQLTLNNALAQNGIDGANIDGAITQRLNAITGDSSTTIKEILNLLKPSDLSGNTLPSSPTNFTSFIPTTDIIVNGVTYHQGYKYVYTQSQGWQELSSPNLFLGSSGVINLYSGSHLNIYSGSDLTIGSGGNLTIGANSGSAASLTLASTGKIQAFAGEIVFAAAELMNNNQPTGQPDKSGGSYFWLHDVQKNNTTVRQIDMGTSGDFQILSGGNFSAIAAKNVVIASAENLNDGVGDGTPDLAGSYIWMRDVEDEAHIIRKVLDIGTTGDFNVLAGGHFNVMSGDVNMRTSQFALNIIDSEESGTVLMSMSADGQGIYAKKIISDSILSAYDGPSILYINSSREDGVTFFKSLNDAVSVLNNKNLNYDVTIKWCADDSIIDEETAEDAIFTFTSVPIDVSIVNISGVLGSYTITIDGAIRLPDNQTPVNVIVGGEMQINACTAQIILNNLMVKERNTFDDITTLKLIDIERCSSVIINSCVLDGNLSSYITASSYDPYVALIYAQTSQLEIAMTQFQQAHYGLYQTSGTSQIIDCSGKTGIALQIEKSIAFCSGTVPVGQKITAKSGQIFDTNGQSTSSGTDITIDDNITPSGSEEQITEDFVAIQTKSARAGSWSTSAKASDGTIDVMQGQYGSSGQWYGCMWFDLSKLKAYSNIRIDSIQLTIRRRNSGGTETNRTAYVAHYPFLKSSSALAFSALYSNGRFIGTSIGNISNMSYNSVGTLNIPINLVNLNNISSDNTLCLLLIRNEITASGGSYSPNYSRYYGKGTTSAPKLTITYTLNPSNS